MLSLAIICHSKDYNECNTNVHKEYFMFVDICV